MSFNQVLSRFNMLNLVGSIFVLLAFSQVQAFRMSRRHFLHHLPPPETENLKVAPQEQFFDQILNHFDAIDSRRWPQRFWENWDNYKEGGPMFIHIGGEGWIIFHSKIIEIFFCVNARRTSFIQFIFSNDIWIGEANPAWLNYGQWFKWAQDLGAAMFLLEHR